MVSLKSAICFFLFSKPSAITGTHQMTRDIDSLLTGPTAEDPRFQQIGVEHGVPEVDDLFALFSKPSAITGTHGMTRDIDALLTGPTAQDPRF